MRWLNTKPHLDEKTPGSGNWADQCGAKRHISTYPPCPRTSHAQAIKTPAFLRLWISFWKWNTISFLLALCLSVWWFQMLLEGLSFVKTLVKFGIIYATDPLLQNMTKIVCFRWLAFDIANYKPLQTMLNYMRQFFKLRIVFHMLYLRNEVGDPQFFCISDTSNSLSDCGKN